MRFEYLVVTNKRAAGVMHRPEWVGVDVHPDTEEATVLAQLGGAEWALAAVVSNPHDTERRYYFRRALP